MEEHQVTFYVDSPNVHGQIASPLSQLSKKFKSNIHIINISRHRSASLDKAFAPLQVGMQIGDVCQITAKGIDSELACFVIKNLIAEFYTVVGAPNNNTISLELHQRLAEISPTCSINWQYAKAQTKLSKFDCIKGLAQLINPQDPDQLALALIKREERSATCIAPGIALPHVMFSDSKEISIAVIESDEAIDWESKFGPVNLVIALILPQVASRSHIEAATNLSRNLLNTNLQQRLLKTSNFSDLQVLLLFLMGKLIA
jgi:PTS system nitrogen regulatory IIA component